jgi:hypothetical protein
MQSNYNGDDVDGVRLRLWTAGANGFIFHPPGDKWAWITMEELYRQGNTPHSSTRALRQSYWHSSWAKQKLGQGNYEFGLTKYFCSYFEDIFNMPQNLTTWGLRLYSSPRRKACYGFILPLKTHRPRPGLNPATLGPIVRILTTASFNIVSVHTSYSSRSSALCNVCTREIVARKNLEFEGVGQL